MVPGALLCGAHFRRLQNGRSWAERSCVWWQRKESIFSKWSTVSSSGNNFHFLYIDWLHQILGLKRARNMAIFLELISAYRIVDTFINSIDRQGSNLTDGIWAGMMHRGVKGQPLLLVNPLFEDLFACLPLTVLSDTSISNWVFYFMHLSSNLFIRILHDLYLYCSNVHLTYWGRAT